MVNIYEVLECHITSKKKLAILPAVLISVFSCMFPLEIQRTESVTPPEESSSMVPRLSAFDANSNDSDVSRKRIKVELES